MKTHHYVNKFKIFYLYRFYVPLYYKILTIMTEKISILIPENDVNKRIREIGTEITKKYNGEQIVLICILKGASFFACELAKRIDANVTLDFMSISSYEGTESSGQITIKKDIEESIEGRHVIIVEDIIDTGRTLHFLFNLLEKRKPKTLELCTLLDKPERRIVDVPVTYTGFTIPDYFVVGYGLDYNQRYRNLPYIGKVEINNDILR